MTEIEIVGFRQPGSDFVPYEGGSLVVYGQNGAGKSLLLESIESALTGQSVGRTAAYRADFFEAITTAVIVRGDLNRIYPEHSVGGISPWDLRESADRIAEQEVDALNLPRRLSMAWKCLFGAVTDGTHGLLAPVGTTEPRWTYYPASAPDDPASEAWAEVLEEHMVSLLDSEEDQDRAYDAWAETDEQHTLESLISNLEGLASDGGIYRYNKGALTVSSSPFGYIITDRSADPDETLASRIRALTPYRESVQDNHDKRYANADEFTQRLTDVVTWWARRANQLFSTFLLDPPALSVAMGDVYDWIAAEPPHWYATHGVRIANLSDAEKRWARIAIALSAPNEKALWSGASDDAKTFPIDVDSGLPAPFVLLDEPERGLHRQAEKHLAAGLLELARTARIRPIVATHSPLLLDAGQGQVFHMEKNPRGGIGTLVELDSAAITELASVGLQPSSLLHLDRGYLLVEGEHDKQIVEGWFSKDLSALRVAVLPMRGTNNLWTIFDSEFLVERTDALLMPVLDDVALEPLYDLWAKAEAAVIDGRQSAATGIIKRGMSKIPGKGKDVYEPMLTASITRGVSQRFFPLGMARKDVLEYLPVGELVEGATSWSELRQEWNRSPVSMADRSGKAYKDWLRKVKRADLTPENLRLVAETTAPHPELKGLIAKVAERLG